MAKFMFYEPVSATTYTFHLNPEEVSGPARPANVQYDSRSSNLGTIPTQGDEAPMVFTLTGSIVKRSQYTTFWTFRELKNSFRLTDEEGQQYEVTMTGFEPVKKRCTYNPFDAGMRLHTYTYTMTLQVLSVISGDLTGLTP